MRFFSALLISKGTCGSVSTSLADLSPCRRPAPSREEQQQQSRRGSDTAASEGA